MPKLFNLCVMKNFIYCALLVCLPCVALADGLKHKGDRYEGEKVVLQLTKAQIREAERGQRIDLTKKQKAMLVAAKGFSPSRLTIISPKDAYNDCACFLFNFGIRYSKSGIDVPIDHNFLCTDADEIGRSPAD